MTIKQLRALIEAGVDDETIRAVASKVKPTEEKATAAADEKPAGNEMPEWAKEIKNELAAVKASMQQTNREGARIEESGKDAFEELNINLLKEM